MVFVRQHVVLKDLDDVFVLLELGRHGDDLVLYARHFATNSFRAIVCISTQLVEIAPHVLHIFFQPRYTLTDEHKESTRRTTVDVQAILHLIQRLGHRIAIYSCRLTSGGFVHGAGSKQEPWIQPGWLTSTWKTADDLLFLTRRTPQTKHSVLKVNGLRKQNTSTVISSHAAEIHASKQSITEA